jgi:hypothetical protein
MDVENPAAPDKTHLSLSQTSPRVRARVAGVLYVLCIICGFYAEMFVRAKLIAYSDPAATASHIMAAPGLYRMGFFADVSNMMFGVLSSVILYGLFKAVSRTVALTVLVLDVISNTVSITASVLLFAPLIVLPGTYGMSAFSSEQLQALSLLSIRMYELAYAVNLALFAGSCLLSGYLIYRSTFLPKFLGLLLALAGMCYLTNSFVNFMPAGFGADLFPWILLPCVLAEGALAVWLAIAGVNSSKWYQVAAAQAHRVAAPQAY